MRIVSLNIGRPTLQMRQGKPYSTAINRRAVEGPASLTATGFVDDRVADDRHHGGPDRAVCCYPSEHYRLWANRLGVPFPTPSFGENFTTEGLLEEEICIGDTFRAGGAVVQVSQPRQPCWKLANKHRSPELPAWMIETGFTGFYVRTLTPGTVSPGDALELVERPHPGATIRLAVHTVLLNGDRENLEQLVSLPELSASWREQIGRKLAGSS